MFELKNKIRIFLLELKNTQAEHFLKYDEWLEIQVFKLKNNFFKSGR